MANLYSGALIDLLCGVRSLFKSQYGADICKICRRMYFEITGKVCFGEVASINFPKLPAVVLLVITSSCIDFASSNPSPQGQFGDRGGPEFTLIPQRVKLARPKCVFIENVWNIINFEEEVIGVIMGLQNECDMHVHVAIVTMQQYGDIENCYRFVIVAFHKSLGEWAVNYRIPVGSFSESVSFCAEDVATEAHLVPARFQRFMKEHLVQPRSAAPGALQKVSQKRPGHGYSTHPYACYDLRGLPPKCTTHAAGRHKPKGWRAEHGASGPSIMFSPEEVARHKNLSDSVIKFYTEQYHIGPNVENLSLDAFLYKCLGNGFSMKFGEAFYASIHQQLQLAGVPFDIESSAVSTDGSRVLHKTVEEKQYNAQLDACVAEIRALTISRIQNLHGDNSKSEQQIYTVAIDTGATEFLVWDEQDSFLEKRRPANAIIQGAKTDMTFSATSRGNLLMACFLKSEKKKRGVSALHSAAHRVQQGPNRHSRFPTVQEEFKQINDLVEIQQMLNPKLMCPPVVTAPRSELRKQLAGIPSLFINLGLNLDIRQWEDGKSCLWKYDPEFPKDESERWEIPLRWDALSREWCFEYLPMKRNSPVHRTLMARLHQDLQESRSESNRQLENESKLNDAEIAAHVLDLRNLGLASELRHVKLPSDFNKALQGLPEDKRLEVIYARHQDDVQVRGVKNSLPKKSVRMMTEADFHDYYGHMGSGKHCILCYLIKGCMRFIYKVTDKYCEERMGYFFDMDTLTMSHRAYCGTKYYTGLRDRGSKYNKVFSLVFRNDFISQFDKWLTRTRADPIYQVYNWKICQVIKCDNDGVWMMKSTQWLKLIEKHCIRMFYTEAGRKEMNCHAERFMGLLGTTGKGCMWQMGLPPGDHVDSFEGGSWLLNRFPPVASLGRDSPDGDIARPLELVTYGWYSRQALNEELVRWVTPGTLVLAHMKGVKGSDIGKTKSEWMVAKRMLGRQLIVYSPWTKAELKIESYTVIKGPRGTHWRDQLGITYEAPRACKPLAGDLQEDALAKKTNTFINLIMPPEVKAAMKKVKMTKNLDFVKHVQDEGVKIIRPPDIEHVRSLIQQCKDEGDFDKANITPEELLRRLEAPPSQYRVRPNDIDAAGDTEQVAEPTVSVPADDAARPANDAAGYAPGETDSMVDPVIPAGDRPIKSKKKKQNPAPSATKTKPVQQRSVSSKGSAYSKMIDNNMPIEFEQVNPKREGSKSWARYELYKAATTLNEMIRLGGSSADINFDGDRGFWKPVQESEQFLAPANASSSGDRVDAAVAELVLSFSQQWQAALTGRTVVLSEPKSFSKVAIDLLIPPCYNGVFYDWLVRVSEGAITEKDLGIASQRRSRCRKGLTIPAPSGDLWSSMLVEGRHAVVDVKISRGEYDAEKVGAALAQLLVAYDRREDEVIEANKTTVRAKDHISGIIPPPKGVNGVYKIKDPVRRDKFIASMTKELAALTEMGTISHMHTADELKDKFGVDIVVTPAVSTLFVFENKFKDGDTSNPDAAAAKGRMCVEGTKRQMQHGVHYDSVYAATPGQDSIMFFSALVVHLFLLRMAFDVGNAYGWAAQDKKLALKYPRGLEQYDEFWQQLYMCLHQNTYGKPDGSNLWNKERDGFWLNFFNDEERNPGWSCRRFIMEQSMFEFTLTTEEGDSGEEVKVTTKVTFLLAWSDDCDMAGQSEPMMQFIKEASHSRWKVKSVSPDFMLGVRRTLTIEDDVWIMTLTQEEYIDGLVAAWNDHAVAAGFKEHDCPDTPVPAGELLSLADDTPEVEWKTVEKRGYKAVCGGLIWVSRFAHKEIAEGISVCCRVMSKPSEKAWRHCMQMVAWLRSQKTRGMRFRSDRNEHGLVSLCDASNKPDPHDSRVHHGNILQWKGGTCAALSEKHTRSVYGTPAGEYMAIRAAAAKVKFFRNLFSEVGLHDQIELPTKVYCDNNTAIQWVKTGKITGGNQYLDLAYHQPREWERDGDIKLMAVHSMDNTSDLMTKPCGKKEYDAHLMVLCGYDKWVIKYPRETMSFT